MDEAVAEAVRIRAGDHCEYCRLPKSHVSLAFEIEHVLPKQHGGTDAVGNLAFSCLHCHRGPNLAGIDRVTSPTKLVRLLNPRRHRWDYHFSFVGPVIVGRTPIGRATINVLNMNYSLMVALRSELIEEDLFP